MTTSEPLGQGDVLEAADDGVQMWQRHLFIITADCDFAHRKHQGRVTCLPLLSANEYHSEMQLPGIRERLAEKPITEVINIIQRSKGLQTSPMRIREWVSEADTVEIIEQLNLSGKDADDAKIAIDSIRLIYSDATDLNSAIGALIDAQTTGPNPPKREKAIQRVMSPIRSAYSNPPGDALFVSSFSRDHFEGYFAYLRHLEQVWQQDIATGPTRSPIKYRRISKLQDRFAHSLIQRFAQVFTAIGLPDEYEQVRDMHADMIGEEFQ
ncbi:hypothetical protein [Rhodococcus sp. MALMAid1271]|uniref:hypothetical protein n=1 Tax=Rhodococcus sp. MALMAid1271 TaxID=3411744 RepID=UPI003BA0F505